MLIELRTPSLIKKIIQLTLSPRFNKPIHESDRQQQKQEIKYAANKK